MADPMIEADTSVSPRKHANVAEQGSNELISVLGVPGATTGFFTVSRVSRQVPWTMVFAFRQ